MTILPVPTPRDHSILNEYNTALIFQENVLRAVEDGPVTLDFREVDWIETAQLTPLACLINRLRSQGHNIKIRKPRNSYVKTWFDTINFPGGTTTTRPLLGNQIPLFRINSGSGTDMDRAIDQIRKVMQHQINFSLDVIMYPFQEILDNVQEHSQSNTAFVMAQNYPKKERIDICITDDGISIPQNYREHNFEFKSDTDALEMAINGRSTKSPQRGFGLKTTSRMVSEGLGGEVLLSSKNATLHKTNGEQKVRRSKTWDGTTFIARLFPPDDSFDKYEYIGF